MAGSLWRAIDFDLRDAHIYGGLLLIIYGLAQVWHPGAFIGGGIILMYLALRKPKGSKPQNVHRRGAG